MLGLGKKKKTDKASLPPGELEDPKGKKKNKDTARDSSTAKTASKKEADPLLPDQKKIGKIAGLKTLINKKRVFIFFFILLLGGGGYIGYSLLFSQTQEKPIYTQKKLDHVTLPDEMLRFSFDQFPSLYQALVSFNSQIILLDAEIQRIDAVGRKYPEQLKIADREKKVWEKAKDSLVKAFSKIEKPVKEIYVLYQVNPEQGMALAAEKSPELIQAAQEALTESRNQTDKLNQNQENQSEGFFQGLIHKLKKKFL